MRSVPNNQGRRKQGARGAISPPTFEIGGAQPPYFPPHIHYTNLNNTSKGYFSNYLR